MSNKDSLQSLILESLERRRVRREFIKDNEWVDDFNNADVNKALTIGGQKVMRSYESKLDN